MKYSNREEAEEAIAAMQGFVIGGNRVRLSWGEYLLVIKISTTTTTTTSSSSSSITSSSSIIYGYGSC